MPNTIPAPEIAVDELMQRIREEVAQRKSQPLVSKGSQMRATETAELNRQQSIDISLARTPELDPPLPQKTHYTLNDFLNLHDEHFLRSAYRAILRREPDTHGYEHFLRQLRNGERSKAEIIGRLRFSPEGKAHAVKIEGLLLPLAFQTTYHLPVIGYLLRLANYIIRLPTVVKNREQYENHMIFLQREQLRAENQRVAHLESILAQLQQRTTSQTARLESAKADATQVEDLLARTTHLERTAIDAAQVKVLAERTERLENVKADTAQIAALAERTERLANAKADTAQIAELAERTERLENAKADTAQIAELAERTERLENAKADTAQIAELAERTERLENAKTDTAQIAELAERTERLENAKADTAQIAELEKRTERFEESIEKSRALKITEQQVSSNSSTGEDHVFDDFYAKFEDHFRGTSEDIKERVSVYLPVVKEAHAGEKEAPILDIGCGRGEWLELLKDNGLIAQGIDLNRVMVSRCQEKGLNAMEAEALELLRGLESNSLGAVTGFHIIEHLHYKHLLNIFDEALRVLKPGGVAIFETPNPENIIVGSCNFYYDPTHLNPLPPTPTHFIMEARGFKRVEIMRLHPASDSIELRASAEQLPDRVAHMFLGAQDYALIAHKD
jgi:2-polyprenyl-3-methyl-5-hydroxy-6-metoxy-1,4-benzoquinol methylase